MSGHGIGLGAALIAAALAATHAVAQTPGRPGGMGGMGGMGAGAGPGSRPPAEARAASANLPELVQIRLAQLEEDLNLRPAQVPLWHAYRDRVLGLLDDVRRAGRVAASESTAPQRLDALTDIARHRLTATEDIADAGKALYAVLSPEQREVADRRLALPLMTLGGNDPGSDLRLRAAPKPPAADK